MRLRKKTNSFSASACCSRSLPVCLANAWKSFTDPGSVKDFQAFAKQTGNDLLSQAEAEKEFVFFLKRK